MLEKKTLIAAALGALAFLTADHLLFQDPERAPGTGGQEPDEAMAAYLELAKPGEEHKVLDALAGRFTSRNSWTLTPGGAPTRVEGRSRNRWILGGRFLQMESTGDFMGQPFESLTFLGFDRRHGRYTLVGMDTLGTYWISAEGQYDPETKVLKLSGQEHDPVTDVDQEFDFVYDLSRPERPRLELWFEFPGVERYRVAETLLSPEG